MTDLNDETFYTLWERIFNDWHDRRLDGATARELKAFYKAEVARYEKLHPGFAAYMAREEA